MNLDHFLLFICKHFYNSYSLHLQFISSELVAHFEDISWLIRELSQFQILRQWKEDYELCAVSRGELGRAAHALLLYEWHDSLGFVFKLCLECGKMSAIRILTFQIHKQLEPGTPSGFPTLVAGSHLLPSLMYLNRKLDQGAELGFKSRDLGYGMEKPKQHLNCSAAHWPLEVSRATRGAETKQLDQHDEHFIAFVS